MLDMGFLATSKEVQYSANYLSLTYSLSNELLCPSMLISIAARGSTSDSILSFDLDQSTIIWDPGDKLMSFLHNNSFNAFKFCHSEALQIGWQLRNVNCSCRNILYPYLPSFMQQQYGVWLSACSIQLYECINYSHYWLNHMEIGVAICEDSVFDMMTSLEFNLTSVVVFGKHLTSTSSLRTSSTASKLNFSETKVITKLHQP